MWPWNDAAAWARLRAGAGCPLCTPLADVVAGLPAALVCVPRAACLAGYACVVHRAHVVELHDLEACAAAAFLADVQQVSSAVARLTGAAKINLLSLGNLVPHLHVHIVPRRPGDRFEGRPLDPGDVCADAYAPTEHGCYADALRAALHGDATP